LTRENLAFAPCQSIGRSRGLSSLGGFYERMLPRGAKGSNGSIAARTTASSALTELSHDRKSDAIARGRELAGNKQTELMIKDCAGKIVGKDSRGNDPRRIKG